MHDDPPVPVVFARVAKRRGHNVQLDELRSFMPEVDRFYQSEYLRDGDFWCVHDRAVQLWLDMYGMMARFCGIVDDGLPQAVYDEYLKPENWRLFDDAKTCLKLLKKQGLRLGVISNWDATLESLLRDMGYLPYFDEVISSAAVACRKPSKAIFEIALERMRVAPQNAMHVGDLPDADGDGAAQVGIRPVIIDRTGRHEDCGYERIDSLEKLVALTLR